ncbi:MAG: triose-phosphate isomerase [Peptococcaceae bacterium]|nr:triose-phosphate isomerase [Peptococcaceae bacterium]
MRKPMIAGNWKMYKTAAEAKKFIAELLPLIKSEEVEVAVFPPAIDIPAVADGLAGNGQVAYGAQNVHWAVEGAYTGELSVAMLKEAGCRYAICGHSERRQYFGDTDETVAHRASAAIAGGIIPVICVGESLAQREAGRALEILAVQLKNSVSGISAAEAANIVIAYEPVWAIGTGKTATAADAQDVIGFLRGELAKIFSEDIAEQIRILYGGSVKPGNIAELMAEPDIDGALVGGASLEAASFAAIINYSSK